MSAAEKVAFGTRAWLELVGSELCAAATRAQFPSDLSFSMLERYRNSPAIADGLLPGFRIEILGGQPSYRVGVGATETADLTIDATIEAVGVLARMRSSDPANGELVGKFMADGSMTVAGDTSRLGAWSAEAHDIVCDRTI